MGYSYGWLVKWLGSHGNNKGNLQQRETRLWFHPTEYSTTEMGQFLNALVVITDCKNTAVEKLIRYDYAQLRPSNVNLDVKVRFCCKDVDSGNIHRFEIPGPKDSIFEKQGQGDRVKKSVLTDLETAFSTYLHRNVVMLWGKKIQRA